MNNRSLVKASLLAGLLMAILSSVPFVNWANYCACMWVWVGGIFGVWFYRRSEGTVTPGQGAAVGLFSGLSGAIFFAILSILMEVAFAGLAAVMAPAEEFASSTLPSFIMSGGMTVFLILLALILFPLFGTISGAIGGAIFGRQKTVVEGVDN